MMATRLGNCYAASEALWHILGGKNSDWQIMRIAPSNLGKLRTEDVSHWFLQHRETGIILDPSVQQFNGEFPDYSKAQRAAFYPIKAGASARAQEVMELLTWQ